MKRLLILALVLFAVPAMAQDKTTKIDTAELLMLRAKVDVLQDALTAATAQIKILQAQVAATGEIANATFAATRAKWEPELLRAHGHADDGWTWDWDAWKPKAPEPKPEPAKDEKK